MRLEHPQVELGIWDTAGQERFHSIQPLYYRDADAVSASPCPCLPLLSLRLHGTRALPHSTKHGPGEQALLVFDLTDSDSLERVRAWVTELQTLVGP